MRGLLIAVPAALHAQTLQINLSPTGMQANTFCQEPAVSPSGRFIAFASSSYNLAPGDTNGLMDVFLYDRLQVEAGLINLTGVANGPSQSPSLSADGRFIAFVSAANNLVAGDNNGVSDVFVLDRLDGSVQMASVNDAGSPGNGLSGQPQLSADGLWLAFVSNATNLAPEDSDTGKDVFLRDLAHQVTFLVSRNRFGQSAGSDALNPSINGDGAWLVFESVAADLVDNDTNGNKDVFLFDRQTQTVSLVSSGIDGASTNGASQGPVISADGQTIAFYSGASNLLASDDNAMTDIFIYDRRTLGMQRFVYAAAGLNLIMDRMALSMNGDFLAFSSNADNLVPNDINNYTDVFLLNRLIGGIELISVANDGSQGTGMSYVPVMNDNASVFAFMSKATNFTIGVDRYPDVMVHDRHVNQAPVAVAGSDQSVYLGETVALDASASQDPDSDLLQYRWSMQNIPVSSAAVFDNDQSRHPYFIPDLLGDYSIGLVVNDGTMDSDVDTLTVHVVPNYPPTAIASADVQQGLAPLTVHFDAGQSFDMESGLSYRWQFNDSNSAQTQSDLAVAAHTFELPGLYSVTLTVTDAFGQSQDALLSIEVQAPNQAPQTQPAASVVRNTLPVQVQFHANATDAEQDMLRIEWRFGDGAISNDSDPTHDFTQPGVYAVEVDVSDAQHTVTGTLNVIVDAETMNVSLERASVRLHPRLSMDRMELVLRLDSGLEPALNDTLIVGVNGKKMIEESVSRAGKHKHILSVNHKNMRLQWDTKSGLMKIILNKLDAKNLRLEDGMQVMVQLTNRTGRTAMTTLRLLRDGLEACRAKGCEKQILGYHYNRDDSREDVD